eukprot:2082126-Pyramimonas_sp.AAC.1
MCGKFLTPRVSPPAHPETMPRRADGRREALLEQSWSRLGPSWAILGSPRPSWSRLGPSWTLQRVANPPVQVHGRG